MVGSSGKVSADSVKSSVKNSNNGEFGKVRALLFPIHRHEFKKLIPLSFMFLAVSMTYTMLRSLKDLCMYAYMSADSIYCIKILGIPIMIFFTILYTFISRKVDGYTRVNFVFGYFLCFMLLFTFVLYPFYNVFELSSLANTLTSKFPRLKPWWDIIKAWPISLLYIHAEAYGSMALSVAFWTFANSIFSSTQAKRMYSFLSSGAAVGALLSGVILLTARENIYLMFVLSLFSLTFILVVYNILVAKIKADPVGYEIEEKPEKTKLKLSFGESMKYLIKSKYLSFVAFIVLGYNMFIPLLESIWKVRVNLYVKDVVKNYVIDNGYSMSDVPSDVYKAAKDAGNEASSVIYGWNAICTGVFSLFLIFFVASSMSKKPWKLRAMFTPLVAMCSTLVFYIFFRKMDLLSPVSNMLDLPLVLVFVLFGMVILSFIKSSKYIFFDTSKEQAYIPLSQEEKITGKAAIDAIGSRMGKGLSSVVISSLGTLYGGLVNSSHIIFLLIFVVIGLWLCAVIGLSPLYKKKVEESVNASKSADSSKSKESEKK